jgi:hypothetical protein
LRRLPFHRHELPAAAALAGQKAWTDEQSQKNFQMVSRFVLPGVPTKSRFLVMALAHEAAGVEFHPGAEALADPGRSGVEDDGGLGQRREVTCGAAGGRHEEREDTFNG